MSYVDMGNWVPGDRVRVKSEYQGQTYAARAKRKGDWIVDYFKQKNWVLKRPDDWKPIPGYPERLLAKAHQIEAVKMLSPKMTSVPTPTSTIHINDEKFVEKFVEEMTKNDPPNLKSADADTDPEPDKIEIGSIVIVNDPHGAIPKGKLFMVTKIYGATIDVTQLFTGTVYGAMKTWLTVLPEKDLTITYLPQ